MHIFDLASRKVEKKHIINEFKLKTEDESDSLDLQDVIVKIDEYQDSKKVQKCRSLDKAMIKFKNMVKLKIDKFEGHFYMSSMIPLVVNI